MLFEIKGSYESLFFFTANFKDVTDIIHVQLHRNLIIYIYKKRSKETTAEYHFLDFIWTLTFWKSNSLMCPKLRVCLVYYLQNRKGPSSGCWRLNDTSYLTSILFRYSLSNMSCRHIWCKNLVGAAQNVGRKSAKQWRWSEF